MLVLTRKLQEKITIAGNITVTVLRVKGQTVRIGIEAPREIRVIRGELPVEALKDGEESAHEVLVPSTLERAAQESTPAIAKPHSKPRNESRLPQRRKFDRYSQPPLKVAVATAGVLAK